MLPPDLIEFFANHQNILWFIAITLDLSITIILYRLFGKIGLYGVIVLDIMLSNLQGPKLIVIFGMPTTLGVILYSGIYFATDILSEKYGKREANRAVMLGFFTSVIIVFMMLLSLLFQPSTLPKQREFAYAIHEATTVLFNFTPRFVFGSLLAYLVSQSWDVWIYHYIKQKTGDKHLWLRNNLSTMSSQLIDTFLYSFVVWWGIVDLQTAIQLGLVKYVFKFIIALYDTPFIYLARRWNVDKQDWSDPRNKVFEVEKQDKNELPCKDVEQEK